MPSTRAMLRARDSDRVAACAHLDTAHAEGQLTDDEHAARTGRAMKAVTVAQVRALLADLQVAAAVDDPARPRSRRRWVTAAATVAVAAGVGAVAGSCESPGGAFGHAAIPVLTTGNGIQHFVAAYRAEFGDTLADEVLLFPERASVNRVSATNPRTYVDYTYDGDFSTWGSDSARDGDARILDLGTVDLPALAQVVSGAPESLRLPGGVVSQVRFQWSDTAADPAPTVVVYVEREDDTRFLVTGFDGEVLKVNLPTD